MKDIIQVSIGTDHIFNCNRKKIGRTGEHSATQFQITLAEELCDCWAYLHFGKANGEKQTTDKLDIVDGKIIYDVPSSVLDVGGELGVQLVLQKITGEIWKSDPKKYIANKSIDATDEIPVTESELAKSYEAGKKAEHDTFWNRLQKDGSQTNYGTPTGFFNGEYYGFDNFYPEHDIRPVGATTHLFYGWNDTKRDHTGDFSKRLEDCGIVFDTSKSTDLSHAFNYNRIDNLPTIDCTGLTKESINVFSNSYGNRKTIQKIKTKESVTYKNWFYNATGITNIAFEGVIGKDIDFSYSSNLSIESMKSIISCLKNYAGTDYELTYTVAFDEACWTRLEEDSTAPDGTTWAEYVASLGWNI